ncbi:MAG: FkbM family methyltransferase [Bacteroidota bacterium]
MKNKAKYLLHTLLGFKNYLFVFSLYKIYTLKKDKNEKDFFQFLKLIPNNSFVLDIGANIGIMTVHLARISNSNTVYSFEPMPSNIEALKRIINYFKLTNVKLIEAALGNSEGQVEMVMPVISKVKMQGLSHVVHQSITEFNEGEKCKVPLLMLDKMDELINSNKRISAIKIDVENFEYFVLEGAKGLIKKYRPIVYAELWENENRENCFELFKNLAYKTMVVVDEAIIEYDRAKHFTQNFIFQPE